MFLSLYDNSARTIEALEAIAGSSVRLGLFMMERIFVNSCIRYNEVPHYSGEVVRTVVVDAESSNLEMTANDQVVANVFAAPRSSELSLMLLRMLQIVFALKDHPAERTTINLEIFLRAIGEWTSEEVLDGINHLLYVKRPLLWVDGKTEYRDLRHMRECKDIVYMTEAGEAYLRKLVRDLVYVQEALMSISWHDPRVPPRVDYSYSTERLNVLRQCLRTVMEVDWQQCARFKAWLKNSAKSHTVRPELITSRIAYNIGRAVLGILKGSRAASAAQYACLSGWKSTLIEAFNKEQEILGVENVKLQVLWEAFGVEMNALRPPS